MNYLHVLSITIVILISSLTMENKVQAQSSNFGLYGGINFSSHLNDFRYSSGDIDLSLDPNISFGYQGGIIVRNNISPTLRFQAEPSLILLGAKYNETFTLRGFEIETESKTELLYLQLPLLIQLTTPPPQQKAYGRMESVTTYHLTGGVFGGYLLNAQFSGTNSGAPIGVPFEGDFSNDITSQYSKFDGGVTIGAGFEHGESEKIGFETRAMLAVINSGDAPELSFNPRNIAITFSVYFLI